MAKDRLTDRWEESNPHLTARAPQCHGCRHYVKGTLACVAFPDGIPDVILVGDHDHRDPYPTDSGITFEALPK